jgi:uncharacterized protein YkwD
MSSHDASRGRVSGGRDGFDRALRLLVTGLAVAVGLTLLVTQAGPSTVGPDRDAAAMMLSLVNEERAANGLAPLTNAPDVAAVAEDWSAAMAVNGELEHNPSFADEICCWSVVTENVAWSEPHRVWLPGDPVERVTRELHDGLLSSPGHRANLLDAQVDQIGIGVHVDPAGNVWVTQNFRRQAPAR